MELTTQRAFDIHARIMANGQILQNTLLEICKDLKTMRDEQLYTQLGYDTFEAYAENAVGIKQRQAYSYIAAYEKLGAKYIEENSNFGITKLELISQISSYEREEFLEKTDVESATVRELKEQVENFKNQIEQLKFTIDERDNEINSLSESSQSGFEEENEQLKQQIAELEKMLEKNGKEAVVDEKMIESAKQAAIKEVEAKYKEKIKKQKETSKKELENAVASANSESNKKIDELVKEKQNLEKQKSSIEQRLKEAEKKAKISGADPKVTMLKIYFDEIQSNLKTVFELLTDVENSDKATADKLKTAIISFLQSTANENQ